MNKKQLIVLWMMVGAICFVVFNTPKYILIPFEGGYIKKATRPAVVKDYYAEEIEKKGEKTTTVRLPITTYPYYLDWSIVAQQSIPILLIGISLILTLSDKKK